MRFLSNNDKSKVMIIAIIKDIFNGLLLWSINVPTFIYILAITFLFMRNNIARGT